MESQKSKTWIWVVVVVLLAVALWWWNQQSAIAPEIVSEGDTTVAIDQDLNAVDLGDVDAELQDLEADVNSL